MNQYPSPMRDSIRTHARIADKKLPGLSFILSEPLPKPVAVFVADNALESNNPDLLIHFHGSKYVPENAVYNASQPLILAVANLGFGSSVYEHAFEKPTAFPALIETILDSVSARKSIERKSPQIYLSSFSAGYGAVRAILKNHLKRINGIILLDGLHTDYVPTRQVLAKGGSLNSEKLADFIKFGRLALADQKKMLITHSEIFPGTYASTTETADYMIKSLNLQRDSVLKWGPNGMQLLSETHQNGLTILGFAGNSAPDHIDHFHGLPEFLNVILDKK
ncbi:MAG: hypothetical protein DWQ05_17535 [Calditrichaeota bacterium]|nr:MAG: hypothetical protein DWQ05_17535 [Calditrichota bacterium]